MTAPKKSTPKNTADSAAPEVQATCAGCGRAVKSRATQEGVAIPRGWRVIGGELLCNDQHRGGTTITGCINRRYMIRAFRVEITGLAQESLDEGRTIGEFRAACSAAARESARYGNWLVQKMYAADPAASTAREAWPKTKDGKPKIPPLPVVASYAPAEFPGLSGAAMSGLSQMVRQWYEARRYENFVALNRTIENYKFGYLPVECRAADWQLARIAGEKERYAIRRLAIQPGKSWAVTVHCDVYNLARLRACLDGSAKSLSLKIVRGTKRAWPGSNGQPTKAWFLRVSGIFPRPTAQRERHVERTLTLGHDAESLLFGTLEDGGVFELPGVELRTLIVGGQRSDRKRQIDNSLLRGVMPRRKAKRWRENRTRLCERRQRKIDALIRAHAAALVRWAERQRVTSIDYEITDRGFLPSFPWRRLRDYIACGCEAAGIALHLIGDAPAEAGANESAAFAGPRSETE